MAQSLTSGGYENVSGSVISISFGSSAHSNLRILPVIVAPTATVSASHLQSFTWGDLFKPASAIALPNPFILSTVPTIVSYPSIGTFNFVPTPSTSAVTTLFGNPGVVPSVSFTKFDFLISPNSGGAIEVNGIAQAAGTDIVVAASALSSLSFVASGTSKLYSRVFNGTDWSAYVPVTITAPVDLAPTVTALATIAPRPGQTIAASTLFTASDPEGDTITQYRFYDAGTGGSRLTVGGQNATGGNGVVVAASALGSVAITAGAGADTLYVKAFDGVSWGQWTSLAVAGVNLAPLASALSSTVAATHLQAYGFSDLFSASDPQGSSFTRYDFYDATPGGGAITLNGVVQAANTDIVVNAGDLSSLRFVASGTDLLYARVYDGHAWSKYAKVTIAAALDTAPNVTALTLTGTPRRPGDVLSASSLFVASDPDGDAITKYLFYDAGTAGSRVTLGGVKQAAGSVVTVAASDLGSVGIVTGNGPEDLYVKAYDGLAWGGWTKVTVTGTNLSPVTTARSSMVSAGYPGASYNFSDLFSTSDPQGSGMTRYDFYDATTGNGIIELNGFAQPENADIVVNVNQLNALTFVVSGTDTLYARAFDGHSWSNYAKVTIGGFHEPVPGISIVARQVLIHLPSNNPHTGFQIVTETALGHVFHASDLFTVITPVPNEQPTGYQFYDATPGSGTLQLNGVSQGNNVVDVAPANLNAMTFVTGASDDFYVRVHAGVNWTGWTKITIEGTLSAAHAAAPLPTLPTLPTLPASLNLALVHSVATPVASTSGLSPSHAIGFASQS